MRNSSLVKGSCADNARDSSLPPKLRIPRKRSGRGAFCCRAKVDRQGRLDEAEVIMPERVARKGVRISLAVNLRFPGAGHSAQGQSEPKTRSKDVVDGRLVNIPAPLFPSEGVTEQ